MLLRKRGRRQAGLWFSRPLPEGPKVVKFVHQTGAVFQYLENKGRIRVAGKADGKGKGRKKADRFHSGKAK